MRELTSSTSGVAPQPVERCFTHLADIEHYPDWYPDTVPSVTVIERDGDGRAVVVDAVLAVAAGPLRKNFNVRMQLTTLRPSLVSLDRVADARGDHEALTIAWKLAAAGETETEIQLDMTAFLDVPRFLPVGQITDEVAGGFLAAAIGSLSAPA
jgi:ribosome-associated toxin RatA of RatAB toxin-antitoxin module